MKEWVSEVESNIDSRIANLKLNLKHRNNIPLLSSPEIKSALEKIQENFIIVPIDKAAGNISIICKRFYAMILVKELGLNANNPTETYEKIDTSGEHIIHNHLNDLKSAFNINNNAPENHCLPKIYWLPKMHKSPIKA